MQENIRESGRVKERNTVIDEITRNRLNLLHLNYFFILIIIYQLKTSKKSFRSSRKRQFSR
jgi:hypothetical protein